MCEYLVIYWLLNVFLKAVSSWQMQAFYYAVRVSIKAKMCGVEHER